MLDKATDADPLALAWIGSSIGAVDLGLVATEVMSVAPSEQLLGPEIGGILSLGYLLAGAVALGNDLSELTN